MEPEQGVPSFYLMPQQLQMLNFLQQNQVNTHSPSPGESSLTWRCHLIQPSQGNLSQQQQQLLHQLQQQYVHQQQHMRMQQEGQSTYGGVDYQHGGGSYIPPARGSQTPPTSSSELIDSVLPRDLQQALSEQEISALLSSRQDLASSLAEDLLAQFSQQNVKNQEPGASGQAPKTSEAAVKTERNVFASLGVEAKVTTNSQFLAESQKWCKSTKKSKDKTAEECKIPRVSINMTADQVLSSCKGMGEEPCPCMLLPWIMLSHLPLILVLFQVPLPNGAKAFCRMTGHPLAPLLTPPLLSPKKNSIHPLPVFMWVFNIDFPPLLGAFFNLSCLFPVGKQKRCLLHRACTVLSLPACVRHTRSCRSLKTGYVNCCNAAESP